ncbi:MAG: TnpV protein [Oscillospiraceae bacterium]|nr:TnpV protein [Oscillospiraceae bacterium]
MKDDYISKIGVYGQMHYRYLRENKPSAVNVMRMKGTLRSYLEEVNADAEEMLARLEAEMAKNEGVTEALKRQDQMAWGAGLRWRPLPKAEAPTEAAVETSGRTTSAPARWRSYSGR